LPHSFRLKLSPKAASVTGFVCGFFASKDRYRVSSPTMSEKLADTLIKGRSRNHLNHSAASTAKSVINPAAAAPPNAAQNTIDEPFIPQVRWLSYI